jgi:predicted permease
MQAVWQDIKYGIRMLVKTPGLTAVALGSLALGITLSTVVFSLADAIWLRPMPFRDPGRVVRISALSGQGSGGGLSYPDYLELQAQVRSLSGLTVVEPREETLFGEEYSQNLVADVVSRNFFSVLGVRPHAGRFFHENDDSSMKNVPSVVLSHALWQHRFGGDPNLVGKAIVLSGRDVIVLGIASQDFTGVRRLIPTDLWCPVETWGHLEERATRDRQSNAVFGRLRSGSTVQQAQAEAEAVFQRLDLRDRATGSPQRALVVPETAFHGEYAAYGLLMMAIVGVVLVIACVNLCGLLLARAETRHREMAVRAALGAGRGRLIRQLLIESLLLSLIGLACSIIPARWLIGLLPAFLPSRVLDFGARLDVRVMTFAAVVSLATVLLIGLAPAVHASRPNLVPVLKADVSSCRPRREYLGLNALVVGQLALALVLVSMASLLLKSLVKCYTEDLGFERKDILLADLSPHGNEEYCREFYRQLLERVRALPGVTRASLAGCVPLSPYGTCGRRKIFLPPGHAQARPDGWTFQHNVVEPDYFKTMGIRILYGRAFQEQDGRSAPKVALVNEAMAKRFWPGEDPLGKQIWIDDSSTEPTQIIGVVQDGKYRQIDTQEGAEPYLYLPYSQIRWYGMILLVEAKGDPAMWIGPVRKEIRALSDTIDIYPMSTIKQYVRFQMVGRDLMTKLSAVLALVALGLASVGLYGVISYAVSRRTQEIGIRIALGAGRSDVLKSVLLRGCLLAFLGGGIGLVVALAIAQALRSALYAVKPMDPVPIGLSFLVLLAVALLASYLPARRAARIDPMVALRYE